VTPFSLQKYESHLFVEQSFYFCIRVLTYPYHPLGKLSRTPLWKYCYAHKIQTIDLWLCEKIAKLTFAYCTIVVKYDNIFFDVLLRKRKVCLFATGCFAFKKLYVVGLLPHQLNRLGWNVMGSTTFCDRVRDIAYYMWYTRETYIGGLYYACMDVVTSCCSN